MGEPSIRLSVVYPMHPTTLYLPDGDAFDGVAEFVEGDVSRHPVELSEGGCKTTQAKPTPAHSRKLRVH
jgi:hypothetical protein